MTQRIGHTDELLQQRRINLPLDNCYLKKGLKVHTREASSTPPTTNFLHSGTVEHRKQMSPLDMASVQQEPIAATPPMQLNIKCCPSTVLRAQDTSNH